MNARRWLGLVVLLVAAAAAITVPRLVDSTVSGSASVESVPGPPSVGDCVIVPVNQIAPTSYQLADGSEVTLPSARFGDCSQLIFGEVVSVPIARGATGLDAHVRAVDGCAASSEAFLGLTGARSKFPVGRTQSVAWEPALDSRSYAVGPSDWERVGGASWLACVIGPSEASGYRGTTRDVFGKQAKLPWTLRTCSVDLLPDQALSSCVEPHRSQLLGWAFFNPSTAADSDVDSGCRLFAAAMLDAEDPTAAGALVVSGTRMQPGGAFVICSVAVAGDAPLVDSVLGVGSGPLPLGR
jgi:hypothetical protein